MQSIEIRTTQNVVIEYELANLRERIFAFIIDLLLVGAFYLLFMMILLTVASESVFSSSIVMMVVYGIVPFGGMMLYHLMSEVLSNGQSWGKRSMGIKVVRLDGEEPGLSDFLLRSVFHVVDTIFSGGILAALLISSSSKNQRLGDMTANTTVIRLRNDLRFSLEDIMNINTLENYEPRYPEVRVLSEQDMLLVKSAVNRFLTYPNPAHQLALEELVNHLVQLLGVAYPAGDPIEFLKTLIRDYIVITR
ncbi:MAG TPA: RDD family protein [Saprospiraceae bacterium]|nr:RDD family protein [Saprospiraceae bacterium]HMQ85434.1 RDD family protein [Saprospiraceae bacterium]